MWWGPPKTLIQWPEFAMVWSARFEDKKIPKYSWDLAKQMIQGTGSLVWNAMQRLGRCVSATQSPLAFCLLQTPLMPLTHTNTPNSFQAVPSTACLQTCSLIPECVFYEELGCCWMTASLQLMLNIKDSWIIKFRLLLLPPNALHHPFISRSGSISEVISICPTQY